MRGNGLAVGAAFPTRRRLERMQRRKRFAHAFGFTLVELMLALSLGSLLFAVMLRWIGADLRLGQAMAVRLRESARQQRSLELILPQLLLPAQ